jgi:hypothetical protein
MGHKIQITPLLCGLLLLVCFFQSCVTDKEIQREDLIGSGESKARAIIFSYLGKAFEAYKKENFVNAEMYYFKAAQVYNWYSQETKKGRGWSRDYIELVHDYLNSAKRNFNDQSEIFFKRLSTHSGLDVN